MKNNTFLFIIACFLGASPSWGAEAMTPPSASPLPVATPGYQFFAVYSGRGARSSHYVPSGYMGDTNALTVSGAYLPTHDGQGTPLRIHYQPKNGQKGWAGLYWQQPANNWGDRAGQTGFDLRGAKSLIFWARGEKGGEKIHEIKVGGLLGRFPDSDTVKHGPVKLTKEWRRYEIDVTGKDLRHIIGGFSFLMNKHENSGDVTFYIDDIAFEMPLKAELSSVESTVKESTPAATGVLTPPVSASKDIQFKSDEAGLRVSFTSQFLFALGQTVLRPESGKVLKQVTEVLKTYPKNDVLVEGHTDNTGNADYNLKLSRLRAEHLRDYFTKEGGFDPQRFRVIGYGKTHPIADNKTKSGRALNRRVEVIILKTAEPK